MKVHFFYSGLLATLITAGCGTESTEPVAPPASTPSAPAPATPQPETSAPVSPVGGTNALADQAPVAEIGPADLTPKLDIFRSAGSGDIDAVKFHLRNGVKPNDRDKTGKTALLNKGARIKALDARGKDVFDYAKDDTIIEILRNHANK